MADPWTLVTDAVMLTRPEFDWEIVTHWVNEGPSVLVHDSTVYLTYLASGTGIEYAMGLLTADAGGDLLDPASWTKSPDPVFTSDATVSIYGPGHNSFTQTADGDAVLVYHGRTYTDVGDDPLNEPNRHARAQVLPFDGEGRPLWGTPVPDTRPTPTSTEVLPAVGMG